MQPPQTSSFAETTLRWLLAAVYVAKPSDKNKGKTKKTTMILRLLLLKTSGKAAATALEFLAKLLLLLLTVLLSWSPTIKEAAITKMVDQLKKQATIMQSIGATPNKEVLHTHALQDEQTTHSLEDCTVLIVGDTGVGKETLSRALSPFAAEAMVNLVVQPHFRRQATQPQPHVNLALVVWDASVVCNLLQYAIQYEEHLRRVLCRRIPIILVCNKTDSMPCPLPQITALDDAYPFIAVSSERSTNVRELWSLVEKCNST